MRNPKYRAWIKTAEKPFMVTVDTLHLDIEVIEHSDGDYHFANVDFKDIELMQSTGLFDKNGVEIFEGDILKYRQPIDRRTVCYKAVSYLKTQASFGIVNEYGNEIPLYTVSTTHYAEVVGNIFEHKDVLKKEND